MQADAITHFIGAGVATDARVAKCRWATPTLVNVCHRFSKNSKHITHNDQSRYCALAHEPAVPVAAPASTCKHLHDYLRLASIFMRGVALLEGA